MSQNAQANALIQPWKANAAETGAEELTFWQDECSKRKETWIEAYESNKILVNGVSTGLQACIRINKVIR
jgi:hypothetical protein